MGRYFKIINKKSTDGDIDYVVANSVYDAIEGIVGDKECPVNGIPFSIEVDGWADLACIGEKYETDDFVIECISEEEYETK